MSNDSSKEQKGWGPFAAIAGVFASFAVSQLLASLLISLAPHILGLAIDSAWYDTPLSQFLYVLLAEIISLGILWIFIRRYRGLGIIRKQLGLGRFHIRDIVYAFVGVAAYFGLYFIVLSVISAIITVDTSGQQDVGFSNAAGGALVFTFISLVILPPIVEEITFRGFLYSGIKRRWGIVTAFLVTSIIFGGLHTLTGKDGLLWIAAIDTFSLSLVLCYLREKTNNIYAGIGLHAIKNFIAFVALFVLHVS